MKESNPVTRDPVCGMIIDKSTALHAERDGETFYFCSEQCRQQFLSADAAGARHKKKTGKHDEQ